MKMNVQKVKQIGKELSAAFLSTCQSRSDYQIEKFVVGEHETPERRYRQCLDEMVRKVAEIGLTEINIEEVEDQIAEADTKIASVTDQYEQRKWCRVRRKAEIGRWQMGLYLEGQLREFNTLYSLFKEFPAYTAEQLSAAEECYWRTRKAKQAQQQIDSGGGVAPDMLGVLAMTGLVPDDFAQRFEKILITAKKENENALPL